MSHGKVKRKRGIVTIEAAGTALVVGAFSFLGFGLFDLYASTFAVRRAVEASLSTHTDSVLKAVIGTDGAMEIAVDTAYAAELLLSEVSDAEKLLHRQFHQLEDGRAFKVEALLRVARIDPYTGSFEGYESEEFRQESGMLTISDAMNQINSFEALFSNLTATATAQGVSILAEALPGRGYDPSAPRFLSYAAVSALRVYVRQSHSPMQYLSATGVGDEVVMDGKITLLRGGLRP